MNESDDRNSSVPRPIKAQESAITYHGIQIQNVGNSTAQRVRVEVEGFR
jgi:hypothetical protein